MIFRLLLNTMRRRGAAPEMSDTERVALAAGSVWLDGQLFSGKPDFRAFCEASYPSLSEAERNFLEGPVEAVCRTVDPRAVELTKELPEDVWQLLRQHRFFGLGIPKRYGGHEFSALAQSTIFGKLASRSMAVSTMVLIPNSVGPGELLVERGTEQQKDFYLPRLARGDEIPCFALTEPEAGSDAAALSSKGTLFRDSRGEMKIRLDWCKRYITLAPVATLLGLAFRLYDPERLLGGDVDIGITCALVHTDLEGVSIGRHHDPLGIPFPNGPTEGHDVVVAASQIIGGLDQAGHGWAMLMEALSGGRAISLPSQAAMGAKYIARVAGAYSQVRQQFGLNIGRFEGIEEPLARIAGIAYLLEASRVMTCGAVDDGHRPAVVSAMMKYNATELCRSAARDGMDILGGAAICLGPRNLMAESWQTAPVGITVEGANILTRTLIVFGQGALRCHPHAHDLLEAIRSNDVGAFRGTLLRHGGHVARNIFRGLLLSCSRGWLARSPVSGETAVYYRRIAWASARFAFYSDLAMMSFGGQLKLKGKLTGRFADALSWMYLVCAVLRRYEAEGRQTEDLPLVHWACQEGLSRIQEAFEGIFRNFNVPLLGPLLRGPALLWCRLNPMGQPPSDQVGREAAHCVQSSGESRERLTPELYVHPDSAWQDLEEAFRLAIESRPFVTKIKQAVRRGDLQKAPIEELLVPAMERGIISGEEHDAITRATQARRKAIHVDDFSLEELQGNRRPRAPRQDVAGG